MSLFRIWLATLLLGLGGGSWAHEAGSYGGVFRSRDFGATWLNADTGLFLNAPLSMAVDPLDSSHLLLGTDLGLFSSRNGGRSWVVEAQDIIIGAVFSVVFLPDGQQALCAGQGGVFRLEAGRWRPARVPDEAKPARMIAVGARADRIYLLGGGKLLESADGGRSFVRLGRPAESEVTALAVVRGDRETVMAVIGGTLMTSGDGGATWRSTHLGSLNEPVDTIAVDADPVRAWAAHADRLYASDDGGATWVPVGRALPEPVTNIRGIAGDRKGTRIVLTTHRGTFRSTNGGQSWAVQEENLPGHLEAGPLARDPTEANILYVSYALVPYAEVWRAAVEGRGADARPELMNLAAATSFCFLLLLAVCRLVRQRSTASGFDQRLR